MTNYPDREEIDEEHLHWHDVRQIQRIDAATMQNAGKNASKTAENTAYTVFDGTSLRCDLPQPSTSAAVERQNVAARPPANNSRRQLVAGRLSSSLIYGTGIDFSRKDHKTKEKAFSNIR